MLRCQAYKEKRARDCYRGQAGVGGGMSGHFWGAGQVLFLDLHAGFVGFCFTIIHVPGPLFPMSFFMFGAYVLLQSWREWNCVELWWEGQPFFPAGALPGRWCLPGRGLLRFGVHCPRPFLVARSISRWNKWFPGVPLVLLKGHWKTLPLSCLPEITWAPLRQD